MLQGAGVEGDDRGRRDDPVGPCEDVLHKKGTIDPKIRKRFRVEVSMEKK